MNIAVIPITDHFDLAINLAIGIKSNDMNQKIALIHTHEIPEGKEWLIDRFFDFVIKEPQTLWLAAIKLNTLNYLAHFGWTAAIVLDPHTMITPGKTLGDLFATLEPYDFTAYCNDVYDFKLGKRSRKDFNFGCDINEAKCHFGFSDTIPQLKSSFLYFRNTENATRLLNTAISVWNSSFFSPWKVTRTAEACLNIACALTGIMPHQVPYMPVFWQELTSLKNDEHIYHQYHLFETDTTSFQSDRVVSLYNRVTDYYRKINGIAQQRHFRSLVPVKEKRKVFGFYHIACMNHFREVVKEQVELLVSSGLYAEAHTIFVACVGSAADLSAVNEILYHYPKFKLLSHKTDLKQFEFPTLRLLKAKANQEKPFFGFYMHTKGVTFPKQPERKGGDHWRGYLNKFTIDKWKENVVNLQQGNDLSGATWIAEGDFKRHFRGNFFWFNSDYVKTLPEIDSLKLTDRFEAEFWIGMGNPMIASMADLQIDYSNQIPF